MAGNRKHGFMRGNKAGRNGVGQPQEFYCEVCEKNHGRTVDRTKYNNLIMCERQYYKLKEAEFKEKKRNVALINESLENTLKELSEHKFFKEKLIDMCVSAANDDTNDIKPINGHPEHPLWNAGKGAKFEKWNDKELLKFLLVHGFSPECLFSQAGILLLSETA